ncbi:MAG TPA: hypothetical protein VGS99_07645 [Gammaproteobacteria bacterium]|nr:hypothetical protein [Gammaproteobacteria bacterium]
MSEQNETTQIAFLQGAWKALLDERTEPFRKTLLADYVSPQVVNRLPEYTTLENVVAECRAQDAFQESYIKFFFAVQKQWRHMTPETRHGIVCSMRDCGLRDKNTAKLLQPLADDEAALTIQWGVADKLCQQLQKIAFKSCRETGLELEQPRATPAGGSYKLLVDKGETLLLALLQERIRIDSTAVTVAVGYVTPVAKNRMLSRFTGASLELADAFRAALLHWLRCNAAALAHIPSFAGVRSAEDLTPFQESLLRERVDLSLDSFRGHCEELRLQLERMPPDPTVYGKVRVFFDNSRSDVIH